MQQPLVQEIDYLPLENYLQKLGADLRYVVLDSARYDSEIGRYTYLALDPFAIEIWSDEAKQNPLASLKKFLNRYVLQTVPDLPHFQGGLAGFFSYDLARDIETLPDQACQDIVYPKFALGLFDVVIGIDQQAQQAWLFSSGFPELNPEARAVRAKQRLQWCLSLLAATPTSHHSNAKKHNEIISNFTRDDYCAAVQRAVEYILNGDIFEVNLSQRFFCEIENLNTVDLYLKLRQINPAPFASFIKLTETEIISSSPERFLKLKQGRVETRPIKGTIQRDLDPHKDFAFQQQLLSSEKDRAENIMIVDLMRNDLSKVCRPGSVKVTKLCGLETYANVHHLVSVIEGKLHEHVDAVDLLQASFPGGSITGAPKIRAMEIIDELEPTRRGPYCGCVGYLGFDGSMDTSILIRSYVVCGNTVTFQTGGAVVLDSIPEKEYAETCLKAMPLLAALESLCA